MWSYKINVGTPCSHVKCTRRIASLDIGRGFFVGVRNSRRDHWRGEGAEQERKLAAEYRAKAESLHFYYPYVGSILEDIAESYDSDVNWLDSEADVAKRLRDRG